MRLVAFDPARAGEVASWAGSSREVLLWCSRDQAPVPAEVVAGWGGQQGVRAYGLHHRARLVGYGELWVDDAEAEVELARLIVASGDRGRGVGRALVGALVERALAIYPDVFMRVHPENVVALRCYASAGFEPVSEEDAAQWNVGQPTAYVWLTYPGRSTLDEAPARWHEVGSAEWTTRD